MHLYFFSTIHCRKKDLITTRLRMSSIITFQLSKYTMKEVMKKIDLTPLHQRG